MTDRNAGSRHNTVHAAWSAQAELRTISSNYRGPGYYPESIQHAPGRMAAELLCRTCTRATRHAVLRDHDPHRDWAETRQAQQGPSLDQLAGISLGEFVERLRGFDLDVRYRERTMPDYSFEIVLRVELDTSKSQWRIESIPSFHRP